MHPGDRCKQVLNEKSSPSSFTSKSKKYDVFLSFAGADTRLDFTDHLYNAFIRRGIKCFKDDVDLPKGEDLSYLFKEIHDSLCAVLVISENYANSKWCLKELAEILECREKLGLKVFPVFYKVDPSDVRHQRGSFRVALANHEKSFENREDNNKVQEWKEALTQVSKLIGWDTRGRKETEIIQEIVKAIWNSIFSNLPSYNGDNFVGIESRIDELNSILEIEADDVRFVGIWGMHGVGKTTLVSLLFDRIKDQFQQSYFLRNVGENSERELIVSFMDKIFPSFEQRHEVYDEFVRYGMKYDGEFFRNRKVLLVLDDVSDVSQLERLACPEWFGEGSRVIITTVNSHLLESHGVDIIYKAEPMDKDESLKLLCQKAFKKDQPPDDDYLELAKTVVKYTGGVPLALNTLGRSLCGRSLLQWKETIERMKQDPDKDIVKLLEISYDGLKSEDEKKIFLDIACFFNGWERDEVIRVLKNCELHPTIGIDVLIERALLVEKTLDGNIILEVHDLLQELARSIVLRDNLRKRSRLWNLEDIEEILKDDKGSEAIQAIALPFNLDGIIEVHHGAFSKMDNLRLLIISSQLRFPNGLKCFPNALKVIQWRSYPQDTLPIGTHGLNNLVEIQMPFSKIKQWNDIQLMKRLKFIDLSNSKDMVETPDFTKIPNLEKLNLEGCSSINAVSDSLGKLKKLAELNLSNCMSLEFLPKKLEMDSLTKLDISWCKKLSVLPEFGDCMKKLTVLDARKTAITKLPKSLEFLTNLKDLYLRDHKELVLGMSIFNLTSVTTLDLSYCRILDGSIPEDLSGLSSLTSLNLDGNYFSNLPSGCFSNLLQLLHLSLNNCEKLKSLPKLPPKLARLYANNCSSLEHLSTDGMWNIVSTLDHEYRHRTNYEERLLQPIQPEYVPEADFLAILPISEIPPWFPNTGSIYLNRSWSHRPHKGEYEFEVDIPTHFSASKWSGLVACLTIEDRGTNFDRLVISWSCQTPEDDYVCIEWENEIFLDYEMRPKLCLMLLDFNQKAGWQHLKADKNSLQIKLRVRYKFFSERELDMECGWRVLCHEEIQEWGDKLTREKLNSCQDELAQLGQSSSHHRAQNGGSNVDSSINQDSSIGRQKHNKKVGFCDAFNNSPELAPPKQDSSHRDDMQDWGDKFIEGEKNKMQSLAVQHADVFESLTPIVRKRVEVLRKIQGQHDELEASYFEERAALEAKYQEFYQPLYTKRYDILNGVAEVEGVTSENAADTKEDKEKGVPAFWLTAMKNNELLAEEIFERDEGALKYLKDIKWSRIESPKGFKLEFYFDTNPYFKNSVLVKTYHMIDIDGPILEKTTGTEIEWYPGKCLTQKLLKKKSKKGSKKAKPITKTESCQSFFNFFNPPQVPEDDEAIDEDLAEELQNQIEQDYDIGSTIRDKIIPHALSWFTGEAIQGEYLET